MVFCLMWRSTRCDMMDINILSTYAAYVCVHTVLLYTRFMSGPLLHPQAVSPRINTINMSEHSHSGRCPVIPTRVQPSKTVRTSPPLPYLAIGRSWLLQHLIPTDRHCIKRTDEEKQNKHNGDNVFLLLLVSPSDKCWAHSVASWHACLRQPY